MHLITFFHVLDCSFCPGLLMECWRDLQKTEAHFDNKQEYDWYHGVKFWNSHEIYFFWQKIPKEAENSKYWLMYTLERWSDFAEVW